MTNPPAGPPSPSPPPRPTFREALAYWFRLGWVNFGGPAGQIALMHRDLVERKKWIGEGRFLHALNFCMLLPGPEAQQLATYVGWLLHGVRGGVAAGALFVLPSVLVLLALSWAYVVYGQVAPVVAALAGVRAVVLAIVLEAVVRIGRRAFRGGGHFALAAAAFLALLLYGAPFPAIVAAAALAGWAGARRAPRAFPPPANPAEDADGLDARPATRTPRPRSIELVLFLLWAAPLAALVAWRGAASLLVDLYQFFTKAAFVTFGGAYAVLAYVGQASERFGWLPPGAMLDGLALAETTPGPLIMVLQFVGFVAAWHRPEGLSPELAGLVGALVVTWVTFLPSFLFVFLGAPHVERLRRRAGLSAALAGITAAVVGVILHLGIVFGRGVLLPASRGGAFDPFAAAVALAALAALLRFKLPMPLAVLAGAAAGLARHLV
jgi:chromate transporter